MLLNVHDELNAYMQFFSENILSSKRLAVRHVSIFSGYWIINVIHHTNLNMFNPHNAYVLLYKLWRPKGFFNEKSFLMSWLALSASFEYLCYGSTSIYKYLFLPVRGST